MYEAIPRLTEEYCMSHAVGSWCWTYTVSDVYTKVYVQHQISQYSQTIEAMLHDVYIGYNKLALHPR